MSHINDPCDAVAEFSYVTGENSTKDMTVHLILNT